jgi:hypothetical protein
LTSFVAAWAIDASGEEDREVAVEEEDLIDQQNVSTSQGRLTMARLMSRIRGTIPSLRVVGIGFLSCMGDWRDGCMVQDGDRNSSVDNI